MNSFLCAILFLTFDYTNSQAESISGKWKFTNSNSITQGMCPMGGNGSGTLTIADKSNGRYTIKYLKGMVCRPPTVCVLPGKCNGPDCTFSVTVPVDSDDGKVTNSAKLTFAYGIATVEELST
jgi:hypothetical protein